MADGAADHGTREHAFDVVIVGAGPSGLAAAIRLKQLAAEADHEVSVCVLEKGSEVGAHILSGRGARAARAERADPGLAGERAPLETPVTEDRFLYLTATQVLSPADPAADAQPGNYIVSLGNVVRWLGAAGGSAGGRDLPGLRRGRGALRRATAGSRGWPPATWAWPRPASREAPTSSPAWSCTPGSRCSPRLPRLAHQDADGAVQAARGCGPQTYGIGVKELWEIEPAKHVKGKVIHTIGWPLDRRTYGGSWLYMFGDNLVSVGFVIGLDYQNPYLSPFEEMQRYKTHPAIRPSSRAAGGSPMAPGP